MVTLIAGAALFGYVNAQAVANETRLGAAAGATADYLAEKFVIVDLDFSANNVSIWLYNNGQIDLQLKYVAIYSGMSGNGPCTNCFYLNYTDSPTLPFPDCSPLPQGALTLPSASTDNNGRKFESPTTISNFTLGQESSVFRLTLNLPSGCSLSYSQSSSSSTYVEIMGINGNQVSSYAAYKVNT
jgi:hypothetical protein